MLKEIFKLFSLLGATSFGGPAAHIAMMEKEVIQDKKWISKQHFLDLIGATNIIPGPNSTEMTMHVGYEKAGWKGLIVAGVSFLGPAVLITLIFAFLYSEYGALPTIAPYIEGIKPAVVALILQASYKLSNKAFKNNFLLVLGVLAFGLTFVGFNEIQALFFAGGLALLYYFFLKCTKRTLSILPILTNSSIFLLFFKIGSILYGSGYVLFAFLETYLVEPGVLDRSVIIDAVAVGQMTPGPVLTTATFIGYQLNGMTGALLATLGIFLPSFAFVAILNPLIPKMRSSTLLSYLLDGINAGAVAAILAVCFQMAQETIITWQAGLIFLLTLIALNKLPKINAAYLVLSSAVLGYLLNLI